MRGGKIKAMGHPNSDPMSDTTLSKESMVAIATSARAMTKKEAIMFLLLVFQQDARVPLEEEEHKFPILLHAISKAGKFCRGNVKMTATE